MREMLQLGPVCKTLNVARLHRVRGCSLAGPCFSNVFFHLLTDNCQGGRPRTSCITGDSSNMLFDKDSFPTEVPLLRGHCSRIAMYKYSP